MDASPVKASAAGPARIIGFDLARGVAVLGMIGIHVQRHWAAEATWTTPLGSALTLLGGPLAAPVFMVLMGASLAWSRRTSGRSLALRGLGLLVGGYLLNLARGPLAIGAGQALGLIGPEGRLGPYDAWWVATIVDILQLAGVALVCIAGLRRVLPARPLPWLLLAAVAVFTAPLLAGIRTGEPLLDAALAVLWATEPNSFYPLLPWGAFPLLGVGLGLAVRAAADPWRELRRWGIAGIALAVVGAWLVLREEVVIDAFVYWRMAPWLVPGILGIVLPWLVVCFAVGERAPGWLPVRALAAVGRRVTRIYVLHWLIVAWGLPFVGYLGLEFAALAVAIPAVALVSYWLAGLRWSAPRLRTAAASA